MGRNVIAEVAVAKWSEVASLTERKAQGMKVTEKEEGRDGERWET